MYSIQDYVVCGSSGVCRVEDIRVPDYAVLKRPHYILQPLYDAKTKVSVPVEGGRTPMRDAIAPADAADFLRYYAAAQALTCSDNRYAGKFASEILQSGQWEKWVGLLKGFLEKRARQRSRGKSLTMREESLYNRVKALVAGELAFSLGLTPEAVEETFFKPLEE